MNLIQQDIDALDKEWQTAESDGESYFRWVWVEVEKAAISEPYIKLSYIKRSLISEHDREVFLPEFSTRLSKLVLKIMDASKSSPLVSEVDQDELRTALKGVLASLNFHRFRHWETHALNDEDRVLGVEPAGQSEEECTFSTAHAQFLETTGKVRAILRLIFPSETPVATALARSETSGIKKYRPNTAFIMMWINKDHPELEDVKNIIQEVFKQFGLTAVRSDEIEHSDVITSRILDEITTSEFLIADLTGERPSVYYEVGYAHSIGKRPILFRKQGTPLHFDLAVHNCPEYTNLTDLRQKLEARLSALTNKPAGK